MQQINFAVSGLKKSIYVSPGLNQAIEKYFWNVSNNKFILYQFLTDGNLTSLR